MREEVINQREVLEELIRGGHDTSDTIYLLRQSEEILRLHQKSRERLRTEFADLRLRDAPVNRPPPLPHSGAAVVRHAFI
jgi:hypothetical protein